jgi:hypothetical protein
LSKTSSILSCPLSIPTTTSGQLAARSRTACQTSTPTRSPATESSRPSSSSAAQPTPRPPDLAPVGESAFVAGEAERDPDHLISGIVAHADLRSDRLDEILDAHVDATRGCPPHP